MTRKRFSKLVLALSCRIAEHNGGHITGEQIRKLKKGEYTCMLTEFGSYQAAWNWMKPVADALMK